ncbi:MAG TPA: DUF2272 domain-containing protein [Stellaceae bacterium]|nr:DUF2272 domain-containing protein [Stellaceae bacterium]
MKTRLRSLVGLLLLLGLTACGSAPSSVRAVGPAGFPDDVHIPPFARLPYQPFSREAAIQIALREWRAFGQPVVIPNTELPFDNERAEGLWQRVGEYWWLGLPMGTHEQGFTGMHDDNGRVFAATEDGNYAWSAAFIDYVMRMAGAGHRFPYSPTHSDYINAARQGGAGIVIAAMRPEQYAPQRGDLICMSRTRRPMRYDDLPTGRFPGHCDIVVAVNQGSLDVIGGNVDNSVSMKHIPVTADGHLAGPDGVVVDPDHPWFVVLQVQYDIGAAPVG